VGYLTTEGRTTNGFKWWGEYSLKEMTTILAEATTA
jgi:hypothetical protein